MASFKSNTSAVFIVSGSLPRTAVSPAATSANTHSSGTGTHGKVWYKVDTKFIVHLLRWCPGFTPSRLHPRLWWWKVGTQASTAQTRPRLQSIWFSLGFQVLPHFTWKNRLPCQVPSALFVCFFIRCFMTQHIWVMACAPWCPCLLSDDRHTFFKVYYYLHVLISNIIRFGCRQPPVQKADVPPNIFLISFLLFAAFVSFHP